MYEDYPKKYHIKKRDVQRLAQSGQRKASIV